MTHINFRIRELRIRKEMTQAQLANVLGKSPSTVGMWETGERKPTSTMLPRLAAALGCTLEELFQQDSA